MSIRINISPCPNDTFMFHAMLHGLVDCEGEVFEAEFADIEQLNTQVITQQPSVSKISCAIISQIAERYAVLRSGAALGFGNGPLVVAAEPMDKSELEGKRVAVPGAHTTAYALMRRLFPEVSEYEYCIFHQVLPRVLSGECQAGVLIHEERFSFEKQGAVLVADLGREWESRFKLPLPLGAIVVSRELPVELQMKIDRILERSIQYAFAHPMASRDFVCAHCRDLTPEVIDNHIKMFVNEYSLNIGADGRSAIRTLNNIDSTTSIFIDE